MATPYRDGREHLREELRRLDLLLWRYLVAWRADRGGGSDHGGLYVSDEQVARLLRRDAPGGAPDRDAPGGDRDRDAPGRTASWNGDGAASRDGGRPAGNPGASGTGRGEAPPPGAGSREADASEAPNPGTDASGAANRDPAAEANRDPAAEANRDPAAEANRDPAADLDARLRSLAERIEARERATVEAGRDLRLVELAERFDLDRRDRDALLVALGPELDLKYEKVYAYLQDDLTRMRPTVGLVLRVIRGATSGGLGDRGAFSRGSSLLAGRLVRLSGTEGSYLSRYVEVDRRLVGFLLGEDDLPAALEGVAERPDPWAILAETPSAASGGSDGRNGTEVVTAVDRLPVDAGTRARVAGLVDRIAGGPPPTLAFVHGPDGSGRRATVAAVAAELGVPLVSADAGRIPEDRVDETLRLLVREARLADAVLHVHGLPDGTGPDDDENRQGRPLPAAVLDRLDGYDGPAFVTDETSPPPRRLAAVDAHEPAVVELQRPSFDLRRAVWAGMDLPDGVDPGDLASKFRLTPGRIADAVAAARSRVDGELTAAAVYEGCRRQSRARLSEHARRVEPTYTWDDIVLPEDLDTQLREVAAHVEHQGRVYADWGFAESYSLGNGVNVMFAGPSGTGKTMAAEIVAGAAGLDLYKVDLASVVSKYVGETESNLGRIFDEAEASDAVLFFDEADALFGERSEVSDAHDRYANVEVDYLLQRMEEHDGVVILATNLQENVDDAFRRRINLSLEFPRPDRELRERIWRSVFPEATPVADLDWEFLSSFELTGGNVKNVALTAAFLAADDDGRVEMRHVVRAIYRELQKTDQLFSMADFGEYEELL